MQVFKSVQFLATNLWEKRGKVAWLLGKIYGTVPARVAGAATCNIHPNVPGLLHTQAGLHTSPKYSIYHICCQCGFRGLKNKKTFAVSGENYSILQHKALLKSKKQTTAFTICTQTHT